jgi:serine/threonine protein kinase
MPVEDGGIGTPGGAEQVGESDQVKDQPDVTGNSPGIAIGHLALKRGLISPEQLREALSEQSKSGMPGGTLLPLDAILLWKGFLTREQLEQVQAIRETTTFETSPRPDPAPPPAPELTTVGKYRLVREAGRGAMAKVYEAFDTELERTVALKMLFTNPNAHPDEAKLEDERFLREARLAANLPKHPHIIGVFDAGLVEGRRYLAMEFVQGVPMDQWIKKGSVSIGRPTRLLRDVALAVHHAHEHGVIHRDLKPANILVDADHQPHIMDFGLAKLVGQSSTASYTESGLAVGTPAYMSPEQASGVKTLDRRTDIFSMGVMLYEILTGRLPFVGASPMETMLKTSKDPVIPPSKITSVQINPVHFKTLEAVCLKALAKDPTDRYSTAEAFAADLTRWLRGLDFRVSNARLRRRILWVSGTAAAALLVAWGFYQLGLRKASSDVVLAQADHLIVEGKPEEALVLYTQVAGREKDNSRAERGREAALRKIQEKRPKPAPPDPWGSAVELLSLVDVSRDVVSGTWSREQGALVAFQGRPARLQIPYHPAEEYDLRIVFARHSGNFCVDLILTRAGLPFTLVLQKGGVCGFERIRGADYHQNASTWRLDAPLDTGRDYTATVEVRKEGVRATFDGKAISVLSSYEDVSMNPDWKLPDAAAVGVGTWDGGAVIRRLDLRELTGKGEPAYAPPPSKKN